MIDTVFNSDFMIFFVFIWLQTNYDQQQQEITRDITQFKVTSVPNCCKEDILSFNNKHFEQKRADNYPQLTMRSSLSSKCTQMRDSSSSRGHPPPGHTGWPRTDWATLHRGRRPQGGCRLEPPGQTLSHYHRRNSTCKNKKQSVLCF